MARVALVDGILAFCPRGLYIAHQQICNRRLLFSCRCIPDPKLDLIVAWSGWPEPIDCLRVIEGWDIGPSLLQLLGRADYAFNAAASFDALAVLSQVNSGSFRPKCPPDEVLL
jgi:hypothetical protein